ncbi:Phage major tail protein 2 [compost metagenome]
MACVSKKYVGREVLLEFAISCGDTEPLEADWKVFGAGRSKTLSLTYDTVDATADDSEGAIRDSLATWLTCEMSMDGVCRRGDTTDSNQAALLKHYINPTATGGQPIIMARLTMPDVTITSAMLMSEYSREFPNDDVATYSISLTATSSTVGFTVEDTPVVP